MASGLASVSCYPFIIRDARRWNIEKMTGKKHSLVEVFEREESSLLRFAVGLVRCRETAEDIVQDAFLKLQEVYDEVDNARAWLYRCVRNLGISHLRWSGREMNMGSVPEIISGELPPDDAAARLEACGLLRMLVAEMGEDDRQLIELKYNDHLSYAQIAQRTGLTVSNVGYKLHHLLKRLAERLRQAGVESAGE